MNIEIVPGGSAVATIEELYDQELAQWILDAIIDDAVIYKDDGSGTILIPTFSLSYVAASNGRYRSGILYTATAPLIVGTPLRGTCTPRRPDGRRMVFVSRGRVIESGQPTTP